MKKTPFTAIHQAAGARMVVFAGYNMPMEFSGITDEHLTVREKAGVFDVSHMGEFYVTGPDAADYLQYITSNDITSLSDGKIQYTCFPNGRGGIVDDLLVYRFNPEKYLLVVNAANTEKDWNWCVKHAGEFGIVPGRDLVNVSDDIAQLAIQGPLAMQIVNRLTEEPVMDMEAYSFREMKIAGIKNALLSTTGYTGAGGCEIYVSNEDGLALWNALFEAGKEEGIKPAGLGARDTLRLEMGYCLYGNDIDDETSAIEAGLGWITKFTDSKNFIDKEFLFKQKSEGVERRLKGFIMLDRGIPRQNYEIVDDSGKMVGKVTSGTMSPVLKQGIGMGYLAKGFWKADTEIFIRVRNKDLRAKIVNTPFLK
jgi:aminomethyltransferase